MVIIRNMVMMITVMFIIRVPVLCVGVSVLMPVTI